MSNIKDGAYAIAFVFIVFVGLCLYGIISVCSEDDKEQ